MNWDCWNAHATDQYEEDAEQQWGDIREKPKSLPNRLYGLIIVKWPGGDLNMRCFWVWDNAVEAIERYEKDGILPDAIYSHL